ncbi:hypothetical protein E1301_Tti023533 [Triplophysa tibetana]|uniref:Immunoglobulin domain-containing protein n=1 Tax=Triplophysa tibetana TaxID=1572043 RepID=A0A5A9NQT2_9TELE|nr:hypothetical protein E1301_Tti023533 [Triplophysa tibetana]
MFLSTDELCLCFYIHQSITNLFDLMDVLLCFSLLCAAVINEENIRSVEFGHSVILYSDVTEIQKDDEIQWRFGDEKTPIAVIPGLNKLSYDERFKDRLKLNPKTGHLTISSITSELSGVYRAKIISSRGTEYRTYRVVVSVNAYEGESLTIHTDSKIQRDSEIKWISEDNISLVTGRIGDYKETKCTYDERFRGRMMTNPFTGDLTITKIRKTDAGVYKLQISSDDKISHKMINVFVNGE